MTTASTITAHRRDFGSIRKLPSGRYQARYTGPDGASYRAPVTYTTKGDARTFLATVRADIARDSWRAPEAPRAAAPTFGDYAREWLAGRDLKPRTRALYEGIIEGHLEPVLESIEVDKITPAAVRSWYAGLATGPTRKAHAYSLLRTILNTAVEDDLIAVNPCRIRGAGQSRRVKEIEPASLPELEQLVTSTPERLRLMVLLAAWCALRFGELVELRRSDVDTRGGVLHVRRAVTWVKGRPIVGTPKSDAGVRDVNIPPHLLPLVRKHLLEHAGEGADGLLFPAGPVIRPRDAGRPADSHLTHDMLKRPFDRAKEAAGRPDLRFHDLRHTGAVLAAQTGATVAELMARLGHSTPGAAMRYQHAAAGRDKAIAAGLSELASRKGQPSSDLSELTLEQLKTDPRFRAVIEQIQAEALQTPIGG